MERIGVLWLKAAKDREEDEQVLAEIAKGLNLLENQDLEDRNVKTK